MTTETTSYFMSMAVPNEALPLVYDSHERLMELDRREAFQLFGDRFGILGNLERENRLPKWTVIGIETTASAARCRYLFNYQRDRLQSDGRLVLFSTDEWVVASTTTGDESIDVPVPDHSDEAWADHYKGDWWDNYCDAVQDA